MNIYEDFFPAKWKARLAKCLETRQQLKDLSNELFILEQLLMEDLASYSNIKELRDAEPTNLALPRALSNQADIVTSRVKNIESIVLTMNKIRTNDGMSVSVNVVAEFVAKATAAFEDSVDDHQYLEPHERKLLFYERMQSELNIVDGVTSGTRLTPERLDKEVTEMHESVPDYVSSNGSNGRVA